jgi:hypothetical protein
MVLTRPTRSVRSASLAIALLVLTAVPAVGEADPAVFYRSLSALVADSDVVVIGRVTSLDAGRPVIDEEATCRATHATLAATEVLKGPPADTVTVRFFSYCGPQARSPDVDDRGLFFLRASSLEAGVYRPTGAESVVLDSRALVETMDTTGVPVLHGWARRPFASLAQAVRDAVNLPETATDAAPVGIPRREPRPTGASLVIFATTTLIASHLMLRRRLRHGSDFGRDPDSSAARRIVPVFLAFAVLSGCETADHRATDAVDTPAPTEGCVFESPRPRLQDELPRDSLGQHLTYEEDKLLDTQERYVSYFSPIVDAGGGDLEETTIAEAQMEAGTGLILAVRSPGASGALMVEGWIEYADHDLDSRRSMVVGGQPVEVLTATEPRSFAYYYAYGDTAVRVSSSQAAVAEAAIAHVLGACRRA